MELCHDVADLQAVVVPIGGGGLCSGVSLAVKQLNPQCRVYGVEPEGADNMLRSRRAGTPQSMERIETIADSLGPPMTTPFAFAMCQQFANFRSIGRRKWRQLVNIRNVHAGCSLFVKRATRVLYGGFTLAERGRKRSPRRPSLSGGPPPGLEKLPFVASYRIVITRIRIRPGTQVPSGFGVAFLRAI